MKSVLITGAYGGMGAATTKLLHELGFRVFAVDKKVGQEIENVIPIQADITQEESVKQITRKIREHTDSLFAIIHFAGIYKLDSLVEMESTDFQNIFDVNLLGAFLVNKELFSFLEKGVTNTERNLK